MVTFAVLDLHVDSFFGGVCFITGQAEFMQRLADAVAIRKSRKDSGASDRRKSTAKVLRQARGRYVIPKRQIRIRNQRRLITRSQIIRIDVHVTRDFRMVPQIVVGVMQVLARNLSAFQSCL